MDPIALYLASGESLYAGTLLLLTLVAAPLRWKNRWFLRLRNLLAWIALALILLACPPIPSWAYALLAAGFLLWFVIVNTPRYQTLPTLRWVVALLALLPALLVCATEWPHRSIPHLHLAPAIRIFILGDSISSGIETVPPWPTVYATQFKADVINLSRPGIGTAEAVDQAAKLSGPGLVIIEIGGNDLLSGVTSIEFEKNLRLILTRAAAQNRTVLMFELPLLPHVINYGRVQRKLAAEFRIPLIPKRQFIQVLSGADATSDGLHLSQPGTEKMSALLHQICIEN